nr:YdcF family protein [Actinomyces sp.]
MEDVSIWAVVWDLGFAALWAALLAWSLRRDHRQLRCGFFALLTTYFLLALLATLPSFVPGLRLLVLLAAFAWFLLMAALPLMLVVNGLQVLRREGRRPANVLSLLLGIGLVAAPVCALVLVSMTQAWSVAAAAELFAACLYLGSFLIILLAQTLVQRVWGGHRAVPHPDAVVVHGAGLINGAVTPLLASRVKTGVEIWQDEAARRKEPSARTDGEPGRGAPVLVMSGGQGADEPTSEASAMAEYAVGLGVPREDIVLEDRSTTTRENIAFTRDLLADLAARHDASYDQVLLVTSSYHAVRTAILASDMGTSWAVAPAPTARYYAINAWLREYVAVLTYRRRAAAVWAALMALMAVGFAALYLLSL